MARTNKKSERGESVSPLMRALCLHGLIATIFLGALGTGFYYIKRYVDREVVVATEPPIIVIKNKPHWMSKLLVQKIAAAARPKGLHSAFDRQMLVDVRKSLEVNPWISKVYQVRRAFTNKPGDTLEIDCEYRVPAALVKWGEFYWLVDRNGVKLPEQYEPEDVPELVIPDNGLVDIRIIEGVGNPPPATGKKWPGLDLAGGLEMVALLSDKPYAVEILKVNVRHFGNRTEPHVVLMTKFNTEIRWGRTPSEAARAPYIEVSTNTKLDYLKKIYTQYGRIDAGQPGGIDIRFDKVTYPTVVTASDEQHGSR